MPYENLTVLILVTLVLLAPLVKWAKDKWMSASLPLPHEIKERHFASGEIFEKFINGDDSYAKDIAFPDYFLKHGRWIKENRPDKYVLIFNRYKYVLALVTDTLGSLLVEVENGSPGSLSALESLFGKWRTHLSEFDRNYFAGKIADMKKREQAGDHRQIPDGPRTK